MVSEKRVFNYCDCVLYAIKRDLNIDDNRLFLSGYITDNDRKRMKQQDYNIIVSAGEQKSLTCVPVFKVDRSIESKTIYTQKYRQIMFVTILTYRNDKPDIAYSIAHKCRNSLFALIGREKAILSHNIALLKVSGLQDLSFLEAEEKDSVQRFQFSLDIAYDLEVEMNEDIAFGTLELKNVEMKK